MNSGWNFRAVAPNGHVEGYTFRLWQFSDCKYPVTAMMDALMSAVKSYESRGWAIQTQAV